MLMTVVEGDGVGPPRAPMSLPEAVRRMRAARGGMLKNPLHHMFLRYLAPSLRL